MADRTTTNSLENNNGKLVTGATYATRKVDEAFNKLEDMPSTGGTFDGLIDELSLYKHALDDNEIKAIFAAGTAGKCKGNRFATFSPRTRMSFGAKSNDNSFHAENSRLPSVV